MTWLLIGAASCSLILALLALLAPWQLVRMLSPGKMVRGCLALLFVGLALALIAILLAA